MLDVHKARQRILQETPVLGQESLPLLTALGRVLARDIVAGGDLPAADISAMDGYAVQHASLQGASPQSPCALTIIGESPAGKPCGAVVGTGETVRIMTGGLLPEGADTVLKQENTVEAGETVLCFAQPAPGDGIRFRGESLKAGRHVFAAGETITPPVIGTLASLGHARVHVHRAPLVAVLCTGDELADIDELPTPAKVKCSNLYALAAQVKAAGAVPLCLGIAPDDIPRQQAMLRSGMHADVVITSGGTSRGKYDMTHRMFAGLGMKTHFSTRFAKPGKPTVFGTIGSTLVFALPGNTSAAMISFDQFIKPVLLKLMGHRDVPARKEDPAFRAGHETRFSHIDSFNPRHGGNKEHTRPPQVPLATRPAGNGTLSRRRSPTPHKPPNGLTYAVHSNGWR